MTTELERFTEAYATLTVATYEPLIMRWFSGWTLGVAADVMTWRRQKAGRIDLRGALSTAHALSTKRLRPPPIDVPIDPVARPQRPLYDADGRLVPPDAVTKLNVETHPGAVKVQDVVLPLGAVELRSRALTGPPPPGEDPFTSSLIRDQPTVLNGRIGVLEPGFDFGATRNTLLTAMVGAVRTFLNGGGEENAKAGGAGAARAPLRSFEDVFFERLDNIDGVRMYEFLPRGRLVEALSPIGIAHYYRQLYFNVREGVGPIEQAFTIAPLETLEVAYETIRRQIHEEQIEVGLETVSETAVETKNLDEVSDKVSSMVQRDTSAAMSASGSGSIGVWQVGAEASAEFSVSSQRSREETSRRLKEVTKRASERITKSFSIRTRDVQDVTTTTITRRTIRNDSADPVSYGLRRVLRRVLVKVQDLGPRLVWQVYIRSPGAGLARSRFVHFREQEPIAIPENPPGIRPKPTGGTETGSSTTAIRRGRDENNRIVDFVTVTISVPTDREIVSVQVDEISDLEGGGKDDEVAVPINTAQWGRTWNGTTRIFSINVTVRMGDTRSVSMTYTYLWEPSAAALQEWDAERQRAIQTLTQEALNAQFEREKVLITERSKIKARPANDLRREERYEVMNRMVSQLFARGDDPSEPTPLEIEYFHKFFDIDGMFTYAHPSWWRPRYTPVSSGLERPAYEITAESEPAPLGSSLGWMIQIDGDARRNELLNSPWVRVCLPIRPNQERDALAWLAKHIEGELGYDPTKEPLKSLLDQILKVRDNQTKLGQNGQDYVTVDSPVDNPQGPLMPQNVFPVIDEFEVTVPTDGMVYDRLLIKG